MLNYNYAKLNERVPEFAPYWFDNKFTTDPTPYGYKPLVYTEAPEQEGYYAVSHWVDNGDEIIQEWNLEPLPPEQISADELADILKGVSE